MHIIVGGGRVGRQLAGRLGDVIIVEKDRKTAEELENLGFNVVLEDATNRHLWEKLPVEGSTVILATNDDEVNLRIAGILREFEPGDIIARIESEEYSKEYLNLGVRGISCGKTIASELLSEIAESRRRYFEIQVGPDNFAGKRLADIDTGDNCTAILVFREGKILRPHPDLVLENGDLIGILCGREIKKTKNPFDEVLAIIRHPEKFEGVMREARIIAERFEADLLILHKEDGKVMCSLSAPKVEYMSIGEAMELLIDLEDKVDLIVTESPTKKIEIRMEVFRKFPVLLAKGKESYDSILAVVNTETPEEVLTYATSFANRFGKCVVLFLDREQLKSVPSAIESPTVEVRTAEFNPLIEVVREVRKGYDLIIFSISNSAGNLDAEFLWKFIIDTESSVLVVR
ncbi:NAD-binding protein [Geoglobus acetivorans]|uniref:NAD-binding protein n=1 Tax=Geoglobus acetivorans TaxID=565033 RepID=A0ABZ3H1Y3_GEOAI|nr:NAD-binding protein [Geoglobus acetivorans]